MDIDIKNDGLIIPIDLLKAHEDGKVVFFCGAGISCPAGLPLFDKLAQKIGKAVTGENIPFRGRSPESFLMELENLSASNGYSPVRAECQNCLLPTPGKLTPETLATHKALLQLAQSRDETAYHLFGKEPIRLVTTNFDNLFEISSKNRGDNPNRPLPIFKAPSLPIPQNTRWDGLVYLHGALDNNSTMQELNELVLTSADFGKAYLTNGWATSFVCELFRNFDICFIGYSANDTIIRYVLDALNADRRKGEQLHRIWSFADYDLDENNEERIREEWKAKGITPVTFPRKGNDFSCLHTGIQKWGEVYKKGLQGKFEIIDEIAPKDPSSARGPSKAEIAKLEWALWDLSGKPAEHFASLNPPPPLSWLIKVFSEEKYTYKDLPLLNIPLDNQAKELKFSLIDHPARYGFSPNASPRPRNYIPDLDAIQTSLLPWIVKYMSSPKLLLWANRNRNSLNKEFRNALESTFLDNTSKNKGEESGKEFLNESLLTLWNLILSGTTIKGNRDQVLCLYSCFQRIEQRKITPYLRQEIRRLLAPKVILAEPFNWKALFPEEVFSHKTGINKSLRQYVDWTISPMLPVPADLPQKISQGTLDLAPLVNDFYSLLLDALELGDSLNGNTDLSTFSYIELPSLRDYHLSGKKTPPQNWSVYLVLLKEAWDGTYQANKAKAKKLAVDFFTQHYIAFKRLALYAASHDACIPANTWSKWLLSENNRWLWDGEVEDEVRSLLISQGRRLRGEGKEQIIQAIQNGIFSSSKQINHEYKIYERLDWLSQAGASLPDELQKRLLSFKESMSTKDSFDDVPASAVNDADNLPDTGMFHLRDNEACSVLLDHMTTFSPDSEDGERAYAAWSDICRKKADLALHALELQNEKSSLNKDALYIFFKNFDSREMADEVFLHLDRLIRGYSPSTRRSAWDTLSGRLCEYSKGKNISDESVKILLRISREIQNNNCPIQNVTKLTPDIFLERLENNPLGNSIRILLNILQREKLGHRAGIPAYYKKRFQKVIDMPPNRITWIYPKAILAGNIAYLFFLDPDWTIEHLLPLFSWKTSLAIYMWKAFLKNPECYLELMKKWKKDFLICANHMHELHDVEDGYAWLLTNGFLQFKRLFSKYQLRRTFSKLSSGGLLTALRELQSYQDKIFMDADRFWTNYAGPFFREAWPMTPDSRTEEISSDIYRMILALNNKYPEAVSFFKYRLVPLHGYKSWDISCATMKSRSCKEYPDDSLTFLNQAISHETQNVPHLTECLSIISEQKPELRNDERYKRLLRFSD